MIVIPDVHGRTFWKEAVKNRKPRETVVFLGDYLDPYPNENLPWEQVWGTFNEIIEYKKKHPKTTILLFGNHDFRYIYGYGCAPRHDYFHERQIRELFQKNKNLFQIAYKKKIGKKDFIFSHAGIHKRWIEDWFGKSVTKKNVVDYLNNLYFLDSDIFPDALDQVSAYRGGWESYGSILWADIQEWFRSSENHYGDVQVFAHTQLRDTPININDTFYDLDVRRGFRIDDDGNVCEMDGTLIKKTEIKKL